MEWKITQLWTKPVEGSLTNVVVTAAWTCIGTQDGFSASTYGTADFVAPDPAQFVPYPDITQDEVLGWVWASGVDKQANEDIIAAQLNNLINPPVVTLPLPWINSPSA
jgi:hypothetical protein